MQRTHSPILPAALVGVGLVLVAIALGLLYLDFREDQAVRLRVMATGPTLSPAEVDKLLTHQTNLPRFAAALASGAAGAGLCGFGGILILSRLRWLAPAAGAAA